ncbi:Fic family protein [Streptococcus devriesei]|uniref:Fic family protein n=1 Tax=Streptococcus devriesei TaxID=231233 RepID=UPI000420D3D8|nr:Fic family protein [Streptococcus devriesei]
MSYKPLKIVKFMKSGNNNEEYAKRFNGFGVIKTNLFPHLSKRGEFKTSKYELFCVPIQEIQMLTQEINDNSNRIKELDDLLPGVAKKQFYNEQLYKSVISTDEIEGIKTTRKEVSIAHRSLDRKKKRKVRLQSTVRMYNDIRKNDFLKIDNLQSIRTIYDQLTDGEIDSEDMLDGELFRDNLVSIIDAANNKTEHVPPISEKQIFAMLQSWIGFINDKTVPVLIKSFLAHYFFENVHPFYDGNGRTGRYILARYLARKLDIYSGLVISQRINQEKKKYYEAFSITGEADNKAEGTFFVQSLMEILKNGQQDIINTLEEKKAILDGYSNDLDHSDYTELQKRILYLLLQSKVFVDDPNEGLSDNDIIELLSHDFAKLAIKREIDHLEKINVIKLIAQRPKKHLLL